MTPQTGHGATWCNSMIDDLMQDSTDDAVSARSENGTYQVFLGGVVADAGITGGALSVVDKVLSP